MSETTTDTITEYQNLLAETESVKERLREERKALKVRLVQLDVILGGEPKIETLCKSGKPKQTRAKLGVVLAAAQEAIVTPGAMTKAALLEFAQAKGVKPESLSRAILVLRKKAKANGD